jgi:hypothetical protein
MIYAMDGGLWLHRHLWKGRRMAHLVSTNKALLLAYGAAAGISADVAGGVPRYGVTLRSNTRKMPEACLAAPSRGNSTLIQGDHSPFLRTKVSEPTTTAVGCNLAIAVAFSRASRSA